MGTQAYLQHQRAMSIQLAVGCSQKGKKRAQRRQNSQEWQGGTCVSLRQLFTFVRIQVSRRWCFPPGFNIALDGSDVWDPYVLVCPLQDSSVKQQVSTVLLLNCGCGLTGMQADVHTTEHIRRPVLSMAHTIEHVSALTHRLSRISTGCSSHQ